MKKSLSLTLPLLAVMLVTACAPASKTALVSNTAVSSMETAAKSPSPGTGENAASQNTDISGGSTDDADAPITPVLPAGRKLIRTVSMDVETEQFDKMISAINAKLTELSGYAEQSDISGSSLNHKGEPIPRHGSISARVPSDKLDSFIEAVSGSGNVTNKSESAQDITLQYSDVKSRKKSLEIEQERIWQLLEKADSIDTVISLEQRLSDIRYQLESMESQLRLYDNQVDYSTVNLNISEVKDYTQAAPKSAMARIRNGLTDNFKSLVSGLKNVFILLIISCPFWILAAITAVLALSIMRHRRKKPAVEKARRLELPLNAGEDKSHTEHAVMENTEDKHD